MSGTAFGAVVLHVAPEAAVGGPLGRLRTGDPIILDTHTRRLDIDIPDHDLAERPAAPARPCSPRRGYLHLHAETVTQADQGCDLRFLAGTDDDATDTRLPSGLLHGWHGGW